MKLVEVNPIGIGTFCLGGGYYLDKKRDYATYDNDEQAIEAILNSINQGQNHIDTAAAYSAGHTEELIAKVLSKIPRESIYLADKLPKSHMHSSAVLPAIKEMLRRLNTSYIDLLYVHDVNIPETMDEYLPEMNNALNMGLIKEIGVSNANLEQLKKAMEISTHPISALQIQMNLVDREQSPEDLLAFCKQNHVKVVAYQPLRNPKFFPAISNEKVLSLANKYGMSIAQVSLNWLIKHKQVIAIPKAEKLEHIKMNSQSLDFTLTPEDLAILDSIHTIK